MEPHPPLREIGCFALVARRLSFSRAAAEASVSQPAVSQAIRRLEATLGVRLFDRTSREVRLTTAGTALLPYAEALLEAAAALSAEATRQAAPARPTIRLAYPPLAGVLAARVVRRLARRTPSIDVALQPAGWSAATAALARGEVPAAILGTPFPDGLATTARFHVTVDHLAVPTGGPLATMPRVRLDQLARHPILVPRHRPPGGMWARLAAQVGGPHRYRVVADDVDDFAAALDFVAAGAGVLPTPRLVVESVRRTDVGFVPLDAGGLRITYGLVWAPGPAPAELMALVHTVQELLRAR